MPEVTEYAPGTPSWVDLATTDVEGAKAFYGKVFGWSYESIPGGEMQYETASLGKGPLAGIMPQPDEMKQMGAPPAWTTYVTVKDVDATAAAAREAGGTILAEPMDVMGMLRMAVVQDPTGGVIGVWKNDDSSGAAIVNEPGAFTWADLVTDDVATAGDFYSSVLGWGTMDMADPEGNRSKIFTVGEAPIASTRSMQGVPTHWGIYFACADADETARAVTDSGGSLWMEPFDTPPGRMFAASDPAGAGFAAIQLNPDFDPTAG